MAGALYTRGHLRARCPINNLNIMESRGELTLAKSVSEVWIEEAWKVPGTIHNSYFSMQNVGTGYANLAQCADLPLKLVYIIQGTYGVHM